MADKDETKQQGAGGEAAKKKGIAKVIPWLITAATVVALAGLGFFAGRLFGVRSSGGKASAGEQAGQVDGQTDPTDAEGEDTGPGWYYDLESVVVNLNEPGVTRYVRVGLTLEISSRFKQEMLTTVLDQKKPLMKHWLTLYLSNQTLNDIRGEKNLRRMQTQISDAFNESLFPGEEPRIKRVLFKELSIQ